MRSADTTDWMRRVATGDGWEAVEVSGVGGGVKVQIIL